MQDINVVSFFDGISCGQQALERSNINVKNYYASEIDKYAIKVTMANYPNTIQLGDVRKLKYNNGILYQGYDFKGADPLYEKAHVLDKVDLVIGGSPCQGFSFSGKRKGMATKDEQEILTLQHYLQLKSEDYEFDGQSYLFWEYVRMLRDIKEENPDVKFLLENVMMGKKWQKVLTQAIGINPICINSSLVSAQNRERLYFTNIGAEADGLFGNLKCKIKQPKDRKIVVEDILEEEVDDKYFLSDKLVNGFKIKGNPRKSLCVDANYYKGTTVEHYLSHSVRQLVVHNTMPRSGDPAKGGVGHLTWSDGKAYCLDTGNSNAIEFFERTNLIVGCDFRKDEGFRYRRNGKSSTLASRARNDESCGQLVRINKTIRRFTPLEVERLQTVKDNFTNHVSDTQRYKMLGNGWTIEVIIHIFSYLN